MKNYIFFLLFVIVFSLHGCNREDDLTHTPFEEDRLLGLLDMNHPLVKSIKEDLGIYLLTQFSDTLDFKFGLYAKGTWGNWDNIEIVHQPAEDVAFALEQFDRMVFSYFDNEEFNKRCFPRKILIAKEIIGDVLAPDVILREPDNQEVGSWSAIGGKYSYLFAFDRSVFGVLDPEQIASLRNVKLYCFISWLYNYNDLYKEIPEEFYALTEGLHREKLATIARTEDPSPIEKGRYNVNWYIGKGMAITKNSPSQTTSNDFLNRLKIYSNDQLAFPSKERDFRNFLNVIFCETEQNIRTYYLGAEIFKKRMQMVLNLLKSYGIDFTETKPVLKEFYH
ncbi:MAG: hypothetical protein RSB69_10605 [Odoribacter sp.]